MNLAAVLIPPSLDAKQALRLRRFGLAALSYAVAIALVAAAWTFGMLPASAALQTAAAFIAINLGLYAAIRSGFNLRFVDPSLTRFQMLVAITILMYIVYNMDDGRNIALFGCFFVFLFGVFRLNTREFTALTLYALAAYALVIYLLMNFRPHAIHNVPREWMSWLGLAGFLPVFTIIGGNINTLRRRLRESEARFRSLTEMSSDFYWESDAEHRLTQRASADKKLSSVSVFRQGAQIGERRWEIPYISPDEAGWRAHRAALDAHQPFRDFRLSRLGIDGTERHISVSGDPVFDASGAFKGYRGVGKDITEQVRRIDDLRRLQAAMDATIDSIYLTDPATMRFVEVNNAACRRLGYTREQLLEMGPQDVLVADREQLKRLYDEVIAAGERGTRAEMHYRTSDGRHGYTELHRRALRSGSGWLIVTLGRDITERKLAEETLQRQNARLLQTEQELLKAHEALAEADRLESVGRLAAGVAHEVKNPLTIIRLGADYLAKQSSQEGSREVLDDMRAAIDRAEHVIRDLLDFSRQRPFAPRPTNINDVIDNAIHLMKHEIKRRDIAIIRGGDDSIPQIHADPDRLVQVFINLLSNAAQAIGRDGSIEIVTRSTRLSERDLEQAETSMLRIGDPVVTVDIRDDGPGFSPEHEKKLFEPFFTTKPVGEGSGLGLAVARSIVIMHRGSIDISNRPEGGASALLMFRTDREHLTDEEANTGSR